jgi:hypothetical protein
LFPEVHARKANYARRDAGKIATERLKIEARYPHSGDVRTPHKSSNENNVLQWPKTGSSLFCNGPLNLLGGGSWKWPGAGTLDGETLAKIRHLEIGGEFLFPPTIFPEEGLDRAEK